MGIRSTTSWRQTGRPKEGLFALWALAALFSLPSAKAAAPSEYEIKATYLLNFAYFTNWPIEAFPDDHAPILIGVLGKDPFDGILKQVLANESVEGRKLELRSSQNIDDLANCHILFISDSETKNLSSLLKQIESLPILSISDSKRFCQLGGAIGFTTTNRKIGFEVNLDATNRSGVKLSGRLLKVAKQIHGHVK